MRTVFTILILILVAVAATRAATPPTILNYQGRVSVNGVNFDGPGLFRFALVDAAGTTTWWSNDGTSAGGSQPTAAVPVTVTKGLYSVHLGDAALTNMTAIPASVFADNSAVYLRVWFDDGSNGVQQLTNDQRIVSAAYAINAAKAQSVVDGAVTASSLSPSVGLWDAVGGNISYVTGNVGIGAATAPSHRLTLTNSSSDDVLRLIGPDGVFGYGARLNFGDGNFVYLDEPHDDGLTIQADEVGIGGDPVNGGAKLQVFGDTDVAGALKLATNAATPMAGMVRWTGSDFEGYDGGKWVTLTGAAVTPVANMVWIAPGEFLLGSPSSEPDRSESEDDTFGAGGAQVTTLITQGFWMGKYEVTQQEYLDLIGSNPSFFTGDTSRPVETVSWFDAQVYCAKLTIQERAAGRLPVGYAYRLPTEAEWEFACRAGTGTAFSYGNDNPPAYDSLTNYGWYSLNSGSTTHPVGGKLPNPSGLYDMHGNVWEWCSDWRASSYQGGALIDPQGAASGSSRVLRGGSWTFSARFCRSAFRGSNNPTFADDDLGFRVVLAWKSSP